MAAAYDQLETKLLVARDRVVHKLKVTIDLIKSENKSLLSLDTNLRQLQQCHERITNWYTKLEEACGQSEDQATKQKFAKDISYYEELFMDCQDTITELQTIIDHLKLAKTSKQNDSPINQNSPVSQSVKLPKLPKISFNGDITNYIEFRQSFDATVGATDLPDNQKLAYLKQMLVNNAENDLKGLPLTNENYNIALKMLNEKYGNESQTIKILYNKISQLPPATNSSINQLRKTYDELEVILRTLESLGESFDNNTILFNTIKEKYPKTIVYEVHKDDSEMIDLKQFRDNIRKLIQKREELNFNDTNEDTKLTYTMESLMVDPKKKTPPVPKCIFCTSGQHWSDECEKYVTIEERKAKIKGRCYICLKRNHSVKECTSDRTCVHCGQKKNHHRSLCSKLCKEKPVNLSTDDNKPTDNESETVNCLLSDKEQNWLFTAVAQVSNLVGDKTFNARIILDGGSKRTFITSNIAKKLNLPISTAEILRMNTVGDNKGQEFVSNTVQLKITTRSGEQIKVEANTITKIIEGIETFNPKELSDTSILKNKELADVSNRTDVQILIGIDHLYDFLTSEIIKIEEHQYLVGSKLGWLFAGKLKSSNTSRNKTNCLLIKTLQSSTSEDLKTLWELDTLGIKETPEMNDETAQRIFDETVRYSNKRYEVAWPWIEENPDLKSHYGLALARLENLVKKSSEEFLSKYDNVFQEYLRENIIELVDETVPAENIIHYLPHHGVETSSKTTPIRPVFDGSAKLNKNDKSFNDCIYKGRNLNELIAMLLLAFQMYKYGIICDVTKAFLQLLLAQKDKDSARFLWLINPKLKTTKNNVAVYRFLRILFGASASPFLLAATIRHHLRKYPNSIVSKLIKALYVDNMATGEDSSEAAAELIEAMIRIFNDASMILRQWQTNDDELRKKFPELDWIKEAVVSLLGLNWNTKADTYSIKPTTFESTVITKRSILKNASKIYDPLGYFSAVTLRAKLILRQLWQEHYDWDQPVSSQLEIEWKELVYELQKLQSIEIPRKFPLPRTESSLQLHVFVDASQQAYGAAVYIRLHKNTQIATKLLFAKSRVAPLKSPIKIPRLELLAALVGSRAVSFVEESLHDCEITKKFLWSDSMCTISWIKSSKILPPVIDRKVKEIQKHGLIVNYVNSDENPADIASRGISLSDLSELWWYGPPWLQNDESKWPTSALEVEDNESLLEFQSTTLLMKETTSPKPIRPAEIELEKFTKWTDLLAETVKQLKQTDVDTTFASAERLWIQYVQRCHFGEVFQGFETQRKSNLERQLNLFLDENNLIRVKGRLSNVLQTNEDDNSPILLPNDQYTKLVIAHTHEELFHAGVSQTLIQLRQKYWIIRGRAMVYNEIKKCRNCRIFNGPAYKYPVIPPLPGFRVKRENAFSYVGIDALGPLYARKQKKAETKKTWIVLFTCLISRAVHLEVLEDMTSEELLNAFRRMFARRGIPKFILSDNAPQFDVLKNLFANNTQQYFEEHDINWKQIPAFAPWAGGIYERIVALIKNAFRRTFYQTTLTRRQLQTVTTEVEAIINSRPIAYVGADDRTVLSPRDLLNIPFNIPSDYNPTSGSKTTHDIAETWKKGRQQLDAFWHVWRFEYIESLRPARWQLHQHRAVEGPPRIGDTVILQEKLLPRGRWKLGRIVKLNESADGAIRSADVEIESGTVVTRPVNLLHPIETEVEAKRATEMDPVVPNREQDNESVQDQSKEEEAVPTRTRRSAFVKAQENLQKWVQLLK